MEKIKIDKLTLSEVKSLLEDKDYSFIIKAIINNSYTLESDTLKDIIISITALQNTKSSDAIITKVSDISSKENYSDFITFIDDNKNYYLIGDLHDDMVSLDQILKAIAFSDNFDDINLIFLGDYVDRGKDRLTLINKIILLKYLLPDNIHLLRGNHELYRIDESGNYLSPMAGADDEKNWGAYHFNLLNFIVNSDNEKNQLFAQKNGLDKELIQLYAECFDSFPTVALLNFKQLKLCAMHGGLPRSNLNYPELYDGAEFDSFNSLLGENTKDTVGIAQKINMLWSDPDPDDRLINSSESRFSFSKNEFIAFCRKYDIDMVVRAHQRQIKGYKTYFDQRLISVFSSGGKNMETDEVVNTHSYYENVSPNILKIEEDNVVSINIDFGEVVSQAVEASFNLNDLKQKRDEQENEIADIALNPIVDIGSVLAAYESKKDQAWIVDLKYPKTNKLVVLQDQKAQFNLNSINKLEDFFGIHQDTFFEIDQNNKTITNLSDITLKVGKFGALLNKGESIRVSEKNIIEIENGASLGVIL
ncbi:MAG: serine/threonine protein phosphatase [Gammaproteobacteria bacterium]|nr:serine/threonine protein phosphatase [Gammaproteobacteria bacterium]